MFFALLQAQVPQAAAITTDELADIIERMETSIVDISMEYEERVVPPLTHEEGKEKMGFEILVAKDGYMKSKFSAASLLPDSEPNRLDWQVPGRFVFEKSSTLLSKDGNSWLAVAKKSYNGQIGKSLDIDDLPDKEVKVGSTSAESPPVFVTTTLLGFSVFRLAYSAEPMPLSARLLSSRLRAKDKVRIDNVERKVDGFNTVRADLLTDFLYEGNRLVYMRIYFSVDHGYTPVKFEHMKGHDSVALSVNVESLEEVANGLWFPSSGTFTIPGSDQVNAYNAIGPILVNQGLTDEHFDIDFPVGTKVNDEIQDKKYVVK
jgi:hypothetical protein